MGRDTSKKAYVDCTDHHELQNSETKVGYRRKMVPRAECGNTQYGERYK